MERLLKPFNISFAVITTIVFYVLSRYNYLLFHGIVETFTIVIAFSIFIIAWNTRRIVDNTFLLFIAMAAPYIALIDILHMFAYKDMGIFAHSTSNLPTQLWIALRYMFSISILVGLSLRKPVRAERVLAYFGVVTAVLILSIFYFKVFPDCYVEGVGLTGFKVYSEYIISMLLIASVMVISIDRERYDPFVYKLLLLSFVIAALSDITFTLYVDVFGLMNVTAHIFGVMSFYLIYKALIETGLTRPQSLLFRHMKESEDTLKKALHKTEMLNSEINHRVKNNLLVVASLLKLQGRRIKDEESKALFEESQSRVRAMMMIHDKLHKSPDQSSVEIAGYINKLTGSLLRTYKLDDSHITMKVDVPELVVDVDIAMPCGLIINELVTNSLKYAFDQGESGEITVTFKKDNGGYRLDVSDNGKGLPEGFDLENAESFGMDMVISLVSQLMGRIEVKSNGGAVFEINIPEQKR